MNLKEMAASRCRGLIQGTQAKAEFAVKYSGYTIWWWGSRLLEKVLDKVKRKTQDVHIWSVRAANNIWADRERLGQEKEAMSDYRSHVIPGHEKPEEFIDASEAVITASAPYETDQPSEELIQQ